MVNVFSNFKLRLPAGRKALFSLAVFLAFVLLIPSAQTFAAYVGNLTKNGTDVYVNGVKLTPTDYSWSNNVPFGYKGTDGKKYYVTNQGYAFDGYFDYLYHSFTVGSVGNAVVGRDSNITLPNDGQCWRGPTDPGSYLDIGNCIAQALYWVLYGLSFVVNWITMIFDFVFEYTVANIKARVSDINVIQDGWIAVRDLANICFIFILLYLSIATILQIGEHGVKQSLSRLIIAAVLINFSLFFVKVIIDVPNIISIQIYNQIVGNKGGGVGGSGIGSAFFTFLKPEQYVTGGRQAQGQLPGKPSDTTVAVSNVDAARNFARTSPYTTFIMMIILYIIICAVFLAATVIFIKRFVMLIFYMIFSPLAFAGMAIPIASLQSAAKEKFWNGLIKEAFYAPVFMMCAWIALRTGQGTFLAISKGVPETSLTFSTTIFAYAVVIVMLVASLFIAEMMGVKGAAGAMSMYKGITGGAMGAARWAGGATWRNTGGHLAETTWNKRFSQQLLTWSGGINEEGKRVGFVKTWAARGAVKALKGASKGYRDTTLAGEKAYMEEAFDEVHMDPKALAGKAAAAWGTDKNGKYRYSTQNQVFEQIHHGWSADRHADVMLELQKLADKGDVGAKGALERLYTSSHRRVDPEMWDKIQTMVKNGRPAHLDAVIDAAKRSTDKTRTDYDPDAFMKTVASYTDGQRRFAAMRLKEGETTKDQTKHLMETIATKDPSGLEAVLRDSMSATSTREVAQNILMWSKVRKVTANTLAKAAKTGEALADDIKQLANDEIYEMEDIKAALKDKKYNYGRGYSSFAEIEASPGGWKELTEVYTELHGAQDTNFANAADNHKRYVFATDETKDAKAIIDKYDTRK